MKILFIGDVCFKDLYETVDYDYSAEYLKGAVPIFDNADYRIMNLETPILKTANCIPIKKSGPNIFGIEKNLNFLKAASCDCVTLANNHIGDYGENGVYETLEALSENGISFVGAGKNLNSAYSAKRIEVKGIKVSLISVCENEFGGAEDYKAGSAAYDIGILSNKIFEEKENSDFTVVIFHGGNEFSPFPSPNAQNRYRLFCDLGADAVIANHTHCPQGYETYKGKPIIYSLGNFFFHSSDERPKNSSWYYGYMTEFEFRKNEKITFNIVPYRYDTDCTHISVFDGARKEEFYNYLSELSEPIANGNIKSLFDGWCLVRGFYLNAFLSFDSKFFDGMQNQSLYGIENLLNCESHREMIARTTKLMCDGILKAAEPRKKYILKMSEINI